LASLKQTEWLRQTISLFIAAQAQVERKNGRKPLVDMVSQISILGPPQDSELDSIRGGKVADRIEDDPRFGRVAADPEHGGEAENSTGSFEAFFSMFGGGGAPPPGMPGEEAGG